MKLENAINRIEKALNTEAVIEKRRNGKSITIDHNDHELQFFGTMDNDAENFYTVKKGDDNGHNGYNGIFHSNLSKALNFLTSK